MPPLDVRQSQSEPGKGVVRPQYAAGMFVECTELAVARLRANGMEITNMAVAARK